MAFDKLGHYLEINGKVENLLEKMPSKYHPCSPL